MTPDGTLPRWVPLGDFLKFLAQLKATLEPLVINTEPTIEELTAPEDFLLTTTYTAATYWLELYGNLEKADRFRRRVEDAVERLEHWRCRAAAECRLYPDPESGDWRWTENPFDETRRSCLYVDWRGVQIQLSDLCVYIDMLSYAIESISFLPNDLQSLILQALEHRSMTQLDLMVNLNIGSKETLYGKAGKGGLKELLDEGVVRSDKRLGGYYRPDAPPTESVL